MTKALESRSVALAALALFPSEPIGAVMVAPFSTHAVAPTLATPHNKVEVTRGEEARVSCGFSTLHTTGTRKNC